MNIKIGALMAALILFLSNIITLFTNDSSMEFSDISTATWVIIGGGAMIAFLKDHQGQATRRAINKITNSGDGGI